MWVRVLPAAIDWRNMLRPVLDRIIVKEIIDEPTEETKGGIILPQTANKDVVPRKGTVVAVGPGRWDRGNLCPVLLKVGDLVYFRQHVGVKMLFNKEECVIMAEGDVIAVEDETKEE